MFVYWLNPNRPDLQFMFNGVGCRKRKVGTERWLFHDAPPPTWPSDSRYQVAEAELDRAPAAKPTVKAKANRGRVSPF